MVSNIETKPKDIMLSGLNQDIKNKYMVSLLYGIQNPSSWKENIKTNDY